jgi:hypothetical protein
VRSGTDVVDAILPATVQLIVPPGPAAKAKFVDQYDGFSLGVAAPLEIIITDEYGNPVDDVHTSPRLDVANAGGSAHSGYRVTCGHSAPVPNNESGSKFKWLIIDVTITAADMDPSRVHSRPTRVPVTVEYGGERLAPADGGDVHFIGIAPSDKPHRFEIISPAEPRPPVTNLSLMEMFRMRMMDDQGFSFPLLPGDRAECHSRVRLADDQSMWSDWSGWSQVRVSDDVEGELELDAPAVFEGKSLAGAGPLYGLVDFQVRVQRSAAPQVLLNKPDNNHVGVVVRPNNERVIRLDLVESNPRRAQVGHTALVHFRVVVEGGGACPADALSAIVDKCKVEWFNSQGTLIANFDCSVADGFIESMSPDHDAAEMLTYKAKLLWKPTNACVGVREDVIESQGGSLTIEPGAPSRWEVSLDDTPDQATVRSGVPFSLVATPLDVYGNGCGLDNVIKPTITVMPMVAAAAAAAGGGAHPWSISGPVVHNGMYGRSWRFTLTIAGMANTAWELCVNSGDLENVTRKVTMDPGELQSFELVCAHDDESTTLTSRSSKADAETSPFRAHANLVCSLIKAVDGQGNAMGKYFHQKTAALMDAKGKQIKQCVAPHSLIRQHICAHVRRYLCVFCSLSQFANCDGCVCAPLHSHTLLTERTLL